MSRPDAEQIYEDLSVLRRRSRAAFLVVKVAFVGVLLLYWKIQVLDHAKYWSLAEANRTREVALSAPRGLILDRSGVKLADNTASFTASIVREAAPDLEVSIGRVGLLLGLAEDTLRARIARFASLPRFKPIPVKDNLTMEEVSRIEARRDEFPELLITAEPKRLYPHGSLAAHVLGYLQELTPDELRSERFKERQAGDLVGRSGIEREYESRLVGTKGRSREIVDSLGRVRGEAERVDAKQGTNITLSLDIETQKAAEALLSGKEGAIVVLDPRSGEVLALASYPTFDPNKFINRFTVEEWMSVVRSVDYPLENRAIRGQYSPGSIFKPAMAIGALESGLIDEDSRTTCRGKIEIYGHPFNCWLESGHGSLDLFDALRYSCNVYFYALGRQMGIEEIARTAEALGLGRKTGIDLPGEKEGLVPHPDWKRKTHDAAWYAGETISVAIGQGPLLVTPLQVAAYTALIANRGEPVTPRLALSLTVGPARLEETVLKGRDRVAVKPSSFEKVIEGMFRSVNAEGTGRAARVAGFDVCGKTGSTQLISAERAEKLKTTVKTHSWFTGFAPRRAPRVVVTVLVEYGGMGGAAAAPLARPLFDLYRSRRD
ncbi:MAG: penicillin-binding protein 2 [Candidatus Aminicenantes bacterium]|nr:penicillin-binding protein 2 [Candidatus Aminicenantes bacterium]